MLWMHIMPFLQEPVKEVFNYSKKMHISACDFVADGFREMHAEDPYEAMAEKMVYCIYNGDVSQRIQMAERLAKETDQKLFPFTFVTKYHFYCFSTYWLWFSTYALSECARVYGR